MAVRVWPWMQSSLPVGGMVLAVTFLAFNMIISKLAMSNGTSFFILSVYSNALATLVLFPCAYLFHRSKIRPLTFPILCRIFLLAVFGCLADIGSYAGLGYSSPTLATELLNVVPAFTYMVGLIFRVEKLNMRRSSDIAKSVGTVISIAGASVVTLYKGPAVLRAPLYLVSDTILFSSQQNWLLGGLLLVIAALSTASWCLLQDSTLKIYPAEMVIIAYYGLFVTIQSTVVALVAERDLSAWKLEAKMGLVAVFYAGIVNITLRLYLMSWCLTRRGPLFVSLFLPLTVVIAVVIGFVFYGEVLYFGSVIGAVVLVIGFYAVIWGKGKEEKMSSVSEVGSSSHQTPLLQDEIEEA